MNCISVRTLARLVSAAMMFMALSAYSVIAQDSTAQEVRTQRRDSAGVAIFTTTLPASGPMAAPFSVDTAAALRLGVVNAAADSSSAIVQLAGARVLRSGTIVIADDNDASLRFFSRYGAPITTAGKRGSEAGNLTSIRAIEPKGDSLVVATTNGIALFNAAGKFLTTTPPFRGGLLAVMPSGRYLVRRSTSETGAYQGQKGLVKTLILDTLFFVDARGTFGGRVATLPGRIHVSLFNPDPNPLGLQITYLESPFEPESFYAGTRTGFFYTDATAFEVRHFLPNGRPNRILRVNINPASITPALAESWRQTILRKYTVVETRRYIEWVLGQYTVPPRLPTIRAMKVASDGRVWVREHVFPPAAAARWHIFGSDGAYQGFVSLPAGWTIHQIEPEFVLVSTVGARGHIVSLHNLRG